MARASFDSSSLLLASPRLVLPRLDSLRFPSFRSSRSHGRPPKPRLVTGSLTHCARVAALFASRHTQKIDVCWSNSRKSVSASAVGRGKVGTGARPQLPNPPPAANSSPQPAYPPARGPCREVSCAANNWVTTFPQLFTYLVKSPRRRHSLLSSAAANAAVPTGDKNVDACRRTTTASASTSASFLRSVPFEGSTDSPEAITSHHIDLLCRLPHSVST
ncbi:unnamed protein product [Soboliphyme baturini]|uniref:Uncharacterized protein n=1 Tax=Soboliphyme baturini TaxID=241478 RepID=A0A183IVU0_9BILA|nr:unnamed protein product [Soboliphyme baturini]